MGWVAECRGVRGACLLVCRDLRAPRIPV